ncbi:MAG: cytochrome c [Chloroflexi bacterium]|nr:cytochrome c [Chloroflexota bacterium]
MSRVQIEISLGILLLLLTSTILVVYGLGEEQRMVEFERIQQAQAIEVGAELFDANCRGCHGPQGEGTPGLCPPLNDKFFFTERMKEVGWGGAMEDYIVATVASGRLASTRPELYPGNGRPAMPAWSEDYGGPLREDQIRYIAAFIMNWESTAPDRKTQPLAGPPVGQDIKQTLPEGDPVKGEALAASQGCVGCHISTNTGPAWLPTADQPGIGTRAEEDIHEEGYAGGAANAQEYLLESIVNPAVFIVAGFEAVAMPPTFGQTLTAQDAADLIAYLLTIQ